MRNFVISLKSAKKRREHIISEFSKNCINFSFFDAQYPSAILNEHINLLLPNLHKSNLTDTEKACFMSHYLLLSQLVKSDLDYMSIFEDDILLSKNSFSYLKDSKWFEKLNLGEHIILKLECFPRKISISKQRYKIENRIVFRLEEAYVGAAGYIISKSAAKKVITIINGLAVDELIPIDEILFNKLINDDAFKIYQINPALCIQERFLNSTNSNLTSDIEKERVLKDSPINNLPSKTITGRMKRELQRLLNRKQRIKFE